MSGAYCKDQKLSGVYCNSLRDVSIDQLLLDYNCLLQRLLGPKAGTTLVQHAGGLDSYVNCSKELIKKLRPHHPCLKFINCLIETQDSAYGCLGLYVGILCTSLLQQLLKLEEQGIPHRVVSDITSFLIEKLLDKLQSHSNQHVAKLDISNLTHILAVVKTSVNSKNIGLNTADKDVLSGKIVEAFLQSVPSNASSLNNFGAVIVTVVEGRPTVETKVLPGILIRETNPNLPIIQNITQKLQQNTKKQTAKEIPSPPIKKHSFYKYSRNFTNEAEIDIPNQTCMAIRIVIFNVPLSFQQSDTECLQFSGNVSSGELFNTLVIRKLKALVTSEMVDIIACQKVICPIIQWELEKCGVLVIERLGTVNMEALRKLSGCQVISDITTLLLLPDSITAVDQTDRNVNKSFTDIGYIGSLSSIKVVEISNRTYFQLDKNLQYKGNSKGMQYSAQCSQESKHCNIRNDISLDHANLNITAIEECLTERMQINSELCTPAESPVVTLVLPVLTPAMSDSLKVLVEGALAGLRQVCLQPLVCVAGGCVDMWLASVVADVGHGGLDVSQSHYQLVKAAFAKVLVKMAVLQNGGCSASTFDYFFDPDTCHLYKIFSEEYSNLHTNSSVQDLNNKLRKFHENEMCNTFDLEQTRDQNPSNKSVLNDNGNVISDMDASNNESKCDPTYRVGCSCGSFAICNRTGVSKLVPIRDIFESNFFSERLSSGIESRNSSNDLNNEENRNCEDFSSSGVKTELCVCDSSILVESYDGKVNALRIALEGVMHLIDVDYCIFDR